MKTIFIIIGFIQILPFFYTFITNFPGKLANAIIFGIPQIISACIYWALVFFYKRTNHENSISKDLLLGIGYYLVSTVLGVIITFITVTILLANNS